MIPFWEYSWLEIQTNLFRLFRWNPSANKLSASLLPSLQEPHRLARLFRGFLRSSRLQQLRLLPHSFGSFRRAQSQEIRIRIPVRAKILSFFVRHQALRLRSGSSHLQAWEVKLDAPVSSVIVSPTYCLLCFSP